MNSKIKEMERISDINRIKFNSYDVQKEKIFLTNQEIEKLGKNMDIKINEIN